MTALDSITTRRRRIVFEDYDDDCSYPVAASIEDYIVADSNTFIKAIGNATEKEIQADPRLKAIHAMLVAGCRRPLASSRIDDKGFKDLDFRFPNFKDVTGIIRENVALEKVAGMQAAMDAGDTSPCGAPGLVMPPLLVAGPPGVGKTRFITDLGDRLGLNIFIVNCAAVTASFVLGGSSTQWGGGAPGKVYQALTQSRMANPIIVLDEIDKLSGDARFDAYGPLYALLEDRTATKFVDEAVDLPIDCSRVNWIATANDLDRIPEPILSRFTVEHAEKPTDEQMAAVVISIFSDLIADTRNPWGRAFSGIHADALPLLVNDSPREVKRKLRTAMGRAAVERMMEPNDAQIVSQQTLFPSPCPAASTAPVMTMHRAQSSTRQGSKIQLDVRYFDAPEPVIEPRGIGFIR